MRISHRRIFLFVTSGIVAGTIGLSALPALADPSRPDGLPPGSPSLTSCPVLRMGSTGSCVTAVQGGFAELGVNLGLRQTGFYGNHTIAAVRAFQQSYGLPVDGVAGPRTLAALEARLVHPPQGVPSTGTVRSAGQPIPTAFDPARAAAVARQEASVTKAPWRSPGGDHCTEFVSFALYAGKMPTDSTWWPFWESPHRASLSGQAKDTIKNVAGGVIPGSPAWDISFDFANYFTAKRGWASRIDLDPHSPDSAYLAGANVGDVIIYDWKGRGDSRDGHAAMVTALDGTRTIVSQQGLGPSENQTARDWDYSTLSNEPLVKGNPSMKVWLIQWSNNARG